MINKKYIKHKLCINKYYYKIVEYIKMYTYKNEYTEYLIES